MRRARFPPSLVSGARVLRGREQIQMSQLAAVLFSGRRPEGQEIPGQEEGRAAGEGAERRRGGGGGGELLFRAGGELPQYQHLAVFSLLPDYGELP